MKSDLFKNMKEPKVIGSNTVDKFLQKISTGYSKNTVIPARASGKGTQLYEELKASTPTWTPNACFENIRQKSKIKDLTGFIYLDVDEAVNMSNLERIPFVYAAWKSFSGNGYGILIKVDNLDLFNYPSIWLHLEEYFANMDIAIDPQTKDISRQNVISYDPDLYKNPQCIPLDANNIVCDSTMTSVNYDWNASEFNYPYTNTETDTGSQSFRSYDFDTALVYKTILDDYEGKEYIIIEEGKGYRDCYVPKSVEDGKRHRWLAGRTISLLFNNPNISYENLLNNILYANKHHMSPPKSRQEVTKLVEHLYTEHQNRNLNYNPRMKKIWFNPLSTLNTTEKRIIVGKENGRMRREKTLLHLQETYDILKKSNNGITQKMLTAASDRSLRTIKDYWHQISI